MASVPVGDTIPAIIADNILTPSTTNVPVPPSPTPEWESDSVFLKDFSSKKTVPGFAKIVKGNFMNLGPSKFSFQRQHCDVFVHSVKVSVKVLAHCLRRIENAVVAKSKRPGHSYNTRMYAVDQRLAIPISYQGWFELLSEDGQSARPITSVHELSKVHPDKVLVRENIKAYIQNEDGKMTFDASKIVIAGDQLVLCEEISLPTSSENRKVKLLRCFDSKGEQVYLSFDQKGIFTPIASDNDFTGVFTIRDVVRRFRLPLTVKLIQGVRPKVDQSKFTGLIRLDWVYTDETAFVCPIEKNHVRLLPIPTDTNLQLVSASNQHAMKSTQMYNTMIVKCNRMITNYNNTIHLIVNLPDVATKNKTKSNPNIFSTPFPDQSTRPKTTKGKVKEERLMDEIDNLYGYVREGGPPPKFHYDSDEESYFEEPAYEPLDDFRARLRAIESGETVTHHSKYKPQDISKLVLANDPERTDDENPYGIINGKRIQTLVSPKPGGLPKTPAPPLPPRQSFDSPSTPSSGSSAKSNKTPPSPSIEKPPPVPPRLSSPPEKYVTTVTTSGVISSHHPSQRTSEMQLAQSTPNKTSFQLLKSKSTPAPPPPPTRERIFSKGSRDSLQSSGSGGKRHSKLLGRDFKDSDISSMTRQSSGSSSGGKKPTARKKMQTLYL